MRTQVDHPTTLASVFRPVLSSLTGIVGRLRTGRNTNNQLADLQTLLASLPLSTDEFGLACNRLKNAQRYLQADETGAAKWELNTLRQTLQAQVAAETHEPRRRKRRA